MRLKERTHAALALVCASLALLETVHDRVCKLEPIISIPHSLQVTHKRSPIRLDPGEMRKCLGCRDHIHITENRHLLRGLLELASIVVPLGDRPSS